MITEATLAQCTSFDAQIWSDLHKDAYGFRPRQDLSHLSAAELDALWERTCDALEVSMEEDRQREAAAVEALEARLARAERKGLTRAPALRAIIRELGCDPDCPQGVDHALWKLDVPYSACRGYAAVLGLRPSF